MRYMKGILVIATSLALFACGNTGTTTGTGVISLNGGAGGTLAGGNGGAIIAPSSVFGDLKFHAGGSVDTSFALPSTNPDFGVNPATIATATTVEFRLSTNPLPPAGTYFVTESDFFLHRVNQDNTTESIITGLTVNAGQILRLSNLNGHTEFTGAVVINGTVTNRLDQDGGNLELRSDSLLLINPGGKVTTTSVAAGASSGLLTLVSTNGVFINQGTIESNGTAGTGGAAGGTSGGITVQAGTFLYNTNTIIAKGGKSDSGTGGAGGNIQLLADKASFSTNGIIDAGGGDGGSGGNGGSLTFSGGSVELGRVVVAGTVTSNGGTGSAGNGGNGGAALTLTSSSGGILVNANVSANGGEGKGTGSLGGNGCTTLQLTNNVGSNTATSPEVSPEGIKVAGNISLNGGQGGAQGGSGGAISILSNYANLGTVLPGFASVEFFGFQAVVLNGGASTGGNGGNGGQVLCDLASPAGILNVNIPAGGVTNEVTIISKGGDANTTAGSGGVGGVGGTLRFTTPDLGGAADPARTLVTNSGGIDVSSGAGDIGGAVGSVTMSAYGNVTNSGGITARGGKGTTSGSAGGSVRLSSAINVANSGGIAVTGGDGSTGGIGGSVSISSGNQTTTVGISANGGNSLTGGTGGNGGTIDLISHDALTNRSSLNVARGSGGSANSAANGTITIDNVPQLTRLPASGAI